MVLERRGDTGGLPGAGERTNAMLWSWRRALQLSLGITRGEGQAGGIVEVTTA